MSKNIKPRIAPLLVLWALCLCLLCGCGRKFDAAAYVKGGLDTLYLGQVSEEYLELVVDSREDCLAMYEENMLNEAKNFGEMFYVGVNNEPDPAIVQLYKDIFARSRYEVGEAVEDENGYTVDVTVHPIDLFQNSYDALDAYDKEFTARFADGEFDELSGSEIEKQYLRGMIDILSAALDDCGYMKAVTVTLHLEKDSGGVYRINNEDYVKLHNNIIAY